MSKVSPGTMTVVIFALLVGLGGAFVVRQQLSKPQGLPPLPEVSNGPQMVYIPVAAVELSHGHTLAFGDIAILKFTPEQVAESEYAGKSYMQNSEQIIGRTLKVPVDKGSPFLPDLLYPEGMGPGIAERLQPGYRAVSVPIENVGAVQGFARPGSLVDVLFRSNSEGDRPEMTLTLLERIQVLAINTALQPETRVELQDDGTVTLAVTPQQAKVLKVVEGRGALSLSLRNPDDALDTAPFFLGEAAGENDQISLAADTDAADTIERVMRLDGSERVTLEDLLGIPRQRPTRQMEVYLGGNREVVTFEISEETEYQLLQRRSRIKTPIAHGPIEVTQPVDTAQVDRRLRWNVGFSR